MGKFPIEIFEKCYDNYRKLLNVREKQKMEDIFI